MSERLETRLTKAQAYDLAQLLKPVPQKTIGDTQWDRLLLLMNMALYSPKYRRRCELVAPVSAMDRILDLMAQRLLDTYPGPTDPTTEQRMGEISDAIQEARSYLRPLL
jgi:hypothetical protein